MFPLNQNSVAKVVSGAAMGIAVGMIVEKALSPRLVPIMPVFPSASDGENFAYLQLSPARQKDDRRYHSHLFPPHHTHKRNRSHSDSEYTSRYVKSTKHAHTIKRKDISSRPQRESSKANEAIDEIKCVQSKTTSAKKLNDNSFATKERVALAKVPDKQKSSVHRGSSRHSDPHRSPAINTAQTDAKEEIDESDPPPPYDTLKNETVSLYLQSLTDENKREALVSSSQSLLANTGDINVSTPMEFAVALDIASSKTEEKEKTLSDTGNLATRGSTRASRIASIENEEASVTSDCMYFSKLDESESTKLADLHTFKEHDVISSTAYISNSQI